MGIFDWLGKTADTIGKAVGIDFSPSGIIKGVTSLAGVVSEAVPVVGPIVSHALPALSSIFGSSERSETKGDNGVFLDVSTYQTDQKVIKDMIRSIHKAVEKSQTDTLAAISKLEKEIHDIPDLTVTKQGLEDAYKVLDVSMNFFVTNADVLATLTPDTGEEKISPFVSVSDSQTIMQQHRQDLDDQMVKIAGSLGRKLENKDYSFTGELVELYVLTVTWLLVYDKVVLHLRGYLAKGYLLSKDIKKYIRCTSKWNIDFMAARSHIVQAIEFLLGDNVGASASVVEDKPGMLRKLREKRQICIKLDNDDSPKEIKDDWPLTAFGYASPGKDGSELRKQRIEGEGDKAKELVPMDIFKIETVALYKMAQFTFFDLSAQRIADVVEKWQNCLIKWNSRVPLAPPLKDKDNKKATHIMGIPTAGPLGPEISSDEKGYPKGTSVMYAISYVTSQGEGLISDWTNPIPLTENKPCVQLGFGPIMRLVDPLNEFPSLDTDENARIGKGIGIMRRVYARYTLVGKDPQDAWVADLMPHEKTIVDRGIMSHGKLNATSQTGIPNEGSLPTGESPK